MFDRLSHFKDSTPLVFKKIMGNKPFLAVTIAPKLRTRHDEKGGVRVAFRAKSTIKIAGKFAVTEEVRGGVTSPTIKNMVLASN